jgi:acetoacetyl-CoA reductase
VVTGGTRGIGAAVSKALHAKGYKVAATYGAADNVAQKFHEETGIAVFKFDVSNCAACRAGVAEIEKTIGPVDVLVNNAGITRDGTLHKMDEESWEAVIRTNLGAS